MINKLKTSSKTITYVVDFINNISLLEMPNETTVEKIVENCGIVTNEDKNLFLYNMQSLIIKSYSVNDMRTRNSVDIIEYFINILDMYNRKLQSNFSNIHTSIWYILCLRSSDTNDIELLKNMIENDVLENEEFENCEMMHKLDILTYYLSLLLNEQEVDIDKINNINNKIKELNSIVRGDN